MCQRKVARSRNRGLDGAFSPSPLQALVEGPGCGAEAVALFSFMSLWNRGMVMEHVEQAEGRLGGRDPEGQGASEERIQSLTS